MSTKTNKGGRPKSDAHLTLFTFKGDERIAAALDKLRAHFETEAHARGELMNGGQSQAIRRVILEAAARL